MTTQLLGAQGVADEVAAESAVGLGDAHGQEPGFGQVGPVLVRARGVAVVAGGAFGEGRAERGDARGTASGIAIAKYCTSLPDL